MPVKAKVKVSPSWQDLQLILYQALGEPVGLELVVSDFSLARAKLYRARELAQDPDLSQLQFRASPWRDDGLVICKGAAVVPKAEPGLPPAGNWEE